MKQIEYYIKTLSPVTIADKNLDATLCQTKQYISGTTVRGFLMESYMHAQGDFQPETDMVFQELFYNHKVRILPAYPVHDSIKNKAEAMVLPLSLMKHKISQTIIDTADPDAEPPKAGYKKWTGFINRVNQTWYPISVRTQARLHMQRTSAANRLLGHSDDGAIFNQEYIEPHQYFKGRMLVDDDVADAFEAYIKTVPESMYIGRSRHAEYGACQCEFCSMEPWKAAPVDINRPLYLLAQTAYLPTQEWQTVESGCQQALAELAYYCKEKGITVSLVPEQAWVGREEINGYMASWQCRQERAYAMTPGSLFPILVQPLTQDSLNVLQEVLTKGLGQRVDEGFGQWRLWQPEASAEIQTLEKEPYHVNTLSKAVLARARDIVTEKVLREIAIEANQTELYKGDTRKHLLKRLEVLMGSEASKQDIQATLQTWRDMAKTGLRSIYIMDGDKRATHHLWDMLLEVNDAVPPYQEIDWAHRLFMPKEVLAQLQQELSMPSLVMDEEKAYKTYWFWLARHQSKK